MQTSENSWWHMKIAAATIELDTEESLQKFMDSPFDDDFKLYKLTDRLNEAIENFDLKWIELLAPHLELPTLNLTYMFDDKVIVSWMNGGSLDKVGTVLEAGNNFINEYIKIRRTLKLKNLNQ